MSYKVGEVVKSGEVVGVYLSKLNETKHIIFVPSQGMIEVATLDSTGVVCLVPTKSDVDNLEVGDLAPDCFGNDKEVISVYARGVSGKTGLAYVLYNTRFGPNSNMSGELVQDTILRTLPVCRYFDSWQLDQIENILLGSR